MSNLKSSLKHSLRVFKDFAKVSSLKMNTHKSELYPIYSPVELKKFLEDTYPFQWTQNAWKYLGIQFPLNLDTIKKANYDNLIKSIQTQLKSWND